VNLRDSDYRTGFNPRPREGGDRMDQAAIR